MATFTRGTALITATQATQLTGQQQLTNVESGGESVIDELLIAATDWCYDLLRRDGHDVDNISNAEVFERSIAWQFLGLLWGAGYALPRDDTPDEASARAFGLSERYYGSVRPAYSNTTDEPIRAGMAVPRVYNRTRKGDFDSSSGVAGSVWNDLPYTR